jgi:hypothetical protein
VFEDFDDTSGAANIPATKLLPVDNGQIVAEKEDSKEKENLPGDEPPQDVNFGRVIGGLGGTNAEEDAASSRLMKMIGVGIGNSNDDAAEPPMDVTSGWNNAPRSSGTAEMSSSPSAGFGISKNPWGLSIAPAPAPDAEAWNLKQMQIQQEEELVVAARALEEQQQRKLREEEVARQQASAAAAAAAQQQQRGQPSQVEMVLMERVSSMLENTWGKADLGSILAVLHREDARVVPLLGNVDALRALLMRHPARIQLVRDPNFGVDVAVLRQTNAQFLQHQQQQQQQNEMERQHRQLLQARQAAAEAKAQEQAAQQLAFELEQQKKQQQQQHQVVVPKVTSAPWFYSDPQGNIQGPFGGDEMRQWLEGGYFKEDLPISQDPKGPFHALSLYFKDWSVAFQPSRDESMEDQERAAMAAAEAEERERREEEKEAHLLAIVEAEAKQQALLQAQQELEEQEEKMKADKKMKDKAAGKIKKAADKEKAAADAAASLMAGTSMPTDQNASSVQLKMLLGLGASQTPEQAVEPSPSKKGTTKANDSLKSQTNQPKQKQAKLLAKTAEEEPAPQQAAPAPAPVAWGGAAQSKGSRKKSMSEIQQEEARNAARVTREHQAHIAAGRGGGGGGNGWASVAKTGTTAWSSTAVKPAAAAGSNKVSGNKLTVVGATNSMQGVRAKQQAQVSAAKKQVFSQKQKEAGGRSSSNSVDDFGADMSPTMENWCKDQLRQINGSDDLTLAAFCMTVKDDAEIKQYLTAYLGTSSQVNAFASEFINRKNGGKGKIDEWETTGKSKGKKGKKIASK